MSDKKTNTGDTKTTGGKAQAKPHKFTYSETFVETAPLGTWKEGRTK